MRSRLRFFALVGLVATAIDYGVVVLGPATPLWLVDMAALTLAASFSYVGNRWITFRSDPNARWVSSPWMFATAALVSGAVDLVGLLALTAWTPLPVPVAKALAIVVAASVRWFFYRWVLFSQVRRDLGYRVERPPVGAGHRLSLVVPAYNEGQRIVTTVEALSEHLRSELGPDGFEIVVVDDGSADDTAALARSAGARVVELPQNGGKGAAVRAGVLAADGDAVIFTDADLAYPPALVTTVLAGIEDGWDMVVGSRRHRDSDAAVRARRIRDIGGRMVNRLTHLVLLGHFRDTQCGLKGFRGDIATALFQRTRIDGFAFDVELFIMAEQDQLSLLEIPVTVTNRPGSSVSLIGDTAALVKDLFRIRRWAGEGRYRPNAEQRAVLNARVTTARRAGKADPSGR